MIKKVFIGIVALTFLTQEGFSQNATNVLAQDTRNVATTPDSYNGNLQFHLKQASTLSLNNQGAYVPLLGMRAWTDNSGGKAFEMAFTDYDQVFLRSGFSPSWDGWRRFLVENGAGSVGISTSSPLEKLHIAGGRLFVESPYLGNGNASGALVRLGGFPNSTWHAGIGVTQGEGVDVYGLDFYTASGTPNIKMKLTPGGNLGLGVNPMTKLDLGLTNTGGISLGTYNAPVGTMRFVGTVSESGTFNGGEILGGGNGASGMAIINTSAGNGLSQDVAFYTHLSGSQSAQKMVIKSDGKVGIGTSNPLAMLSVKGDIFSRKVKVTQSASDWPDYVFRRGYHLPSLQDVERYVKQYYHLPGIASAAEIEKNGLDLGENQVVLLKKVEELTLYVIQLQKQIDAQRNETKKLKIKLNKKIRK